MTYVFSVTRIVISNVKTIQSLSKVRVSGIFILSNEHGIYIFIFLYVNSDFVN